MSNVECSTAIMREYKKQLEKRYIEQLDDEKFDDVSPEVNFRKKQIVMKDLPKIEIAPEDIPKKPKPLYVLSKDARKKVELERNVPEVEYKFQFTPEKLDAQPLQVPVDFGRDYLQEQLVDLTFQFSRLSMPVCE